jgi:hypothetical protein
MAMTTTTRILTFASLTALAVLCVGAAPARADHDHDHLGNIGRMGSEIAGHARELQFFIRDRVDGSERRELIADAAQLELSARRIQSFGRIRNFALVERELQVSRQLARHLREHGYAIGLDRSRTFRSELGSIEQDLSYISRELAREDSHFRPYPVRPVRPAGFSIGAGGFQLNLR